MNLLNLVMNSIKTYTFILFSLAFCSGCHTNSSENMELNQVDTLNVINEKDILEAPLKEQGIADSNGTVLETHYEDIKGSANLDSALTKKQLILKAEDVGTDVWLGDPFEDPDYIGTPCEDDENGNCIRHNHHKNDFHQALGLEPDSLNRLKN